MISHVVPETYLTVSLLLTGYDTVVGFFISIILFSSRAMSMSIFAAKYPL